MLKINVSNTNVFMIMQLKYFHDIVNPKYCGDFSFWL